jgi:WD40-like Beta Propeller Repeat
VRLTTNPYGANDVATDISPDGSRFVFLRYRPGPTHGGPKEFITVQVALFTAKIDGTDVRRLTPYGLAEPHEFAAAQWSPDGAQIISEKTKGGCSSSASTAPASRPSILRPAPPSISRSHPTGRPTGPRSCSACSSTGRRTFTRRRPTALTSLKSPTRPNSRTDLIGGGTLLRDEMRCLDGGQVEGVSVARPVILGRLRAHARG